MGGWKTKLGVGVIILSSALQAAGVDFQMPTVDPDMAARATSIGQMLGIALGIFGIRDKLNKM